MVDELEGDIPTGTVTQRERVEPVYGIDDNFEEQGLTNFTVDVSELSEGGLSDILCTIIGLSVQPGEGEKMGNDGKPYMDADKLLMHLRIDNADDLGIDYSETVQRFNLPKMTAGKDGKMRRGKPTRVSTYGTFLYVLESLGVSANGEEAFCYKFDGLLDLIGLKFHRLRQEYEGIRKGEIQKLDMPAAILGMDDEVRAAAKDSKGKSLKLAPRADKVNIEAAA